MRIALEKASEVDLLLLSDSIATITVVVAVAERKSVWTQYLC